MCHQYVVQEDSKDQEEIIFSQGFLGEIGFPIMQNSIHLKIKPMSSSSSLKSWAYHPMNLFYSMVCVIILQSNRHKFSKASFFLPSLYTNSIYHEVISIIQNNSFLFFPISSDRFSA